MTFLTKIAMILSLSGAVFVSALYPLYGNIVWVISGIIWFYHFNRIKQTDASIVQFLFTLISAWGVYMWYMAG